MDETAAALDASGGLTEMIARVGRATRRWDYLSWYWGDAIAIDSLLEPPAADDAANSRHVAEAIERWARHCPPGFDDALAPGRAIVRLVARGMITPAAVDRFIGAVDRLPRIAGRVPILEPRRAPFRFGVCIDALYHLPPALAAYAAWCGDTRRMRDAVEMAVWTLDALACDDGWAQWYDGPRAENNAIAWSRGIGWALLGHLDLLEIAAGRVQADDLRRQVAGMLGRLCGTQGPDGNWRSVLGDAQSPYESSTASFFVAAALHPALPEGLRVPARALGHAIRAVRRVVGPGGILRGVSSDILPSWDASGYRAFTVEPSPWGQGAGLRALCALSRSRPPGQAAG